MRSHRRPQKTIRSSSRRLKSPQPVFAGIERGGTWTRGVVLNSRGHVLRRFHVASGAIDQLPSLLSQRLRKYQDRLAGLAIGSRGIWTSSARQALAKTLHALAPKVYVTSDVEAAWEAAFTKTGILLIAGTGSIAYGKDRRGRAFRAGGKGPDKGDEGSAYWIGRQWGGHSAAQTPSVRALAARARIVLKRALKKDSRALEILNHAADELVALVQEIAGQGSWNHPIPLATRGGVIEHPFFARLFWRRLAAHEPGHFRHYFLRQEPAKALATSIMQTYGTSHTRHA